MRTFVRLRKILASHADLAERLETLERKYDEQFRVVFDAIRQLMREDTAERKSIGFKVKEDRAGYPVAYCHVIPFLGNRDSFAEASPAQRIDCLHTFVNCVNCLD
jgi:hypothetical protein